MNDSKTCSGAAKKLRRKLYSLPAPLAAALAVCIAAAAASLAAAVMLPIRHGIDFASAAGCAALLAVAAEVCVYLAGIIKRCSRLLKNGRKTARMLRQRGLTEQAAEEICRTDNVKCPSFFSLREPAGLSLDVNSVSKGFVFIMRERMIIPCEEVFAMRAFFNGRDDIFWVMDSNACSYELMRACGKIYTSELTDAIAGAGTVLRSKNPDCVIKTLV